MEKEYLIILSALTNLVLGFIAYGKNRKHPTNQSFFLFSIVVFAWSIALFFYTHPILVTPLVWIRITYLIALFGSPSFFYLCATFANKPKQTIFRITTVFVVLSIPIAWFVIATPLVAKEVILYPWGYHTVMGGTVYLLFIGFMLTYALIGIFFLLQKYIKSKDIERNQIFYIFLGLGLFFVSAATTDAIIPIFAGTSKYFWISPVFLFFPIIFMTFAITEYHLFAIRVILTEVLIIIMGAVLLALPVLMPTNALRILTSSVFLLFCVFGYLLIRATHKEIKRRKEMEELANKLSVSEEKIKEQLKELVQKHKFVSILRRLDQIIMNTLDLQEMAQKIVDTVSWELGFAGGIIGVLSEKGEILNFLAISQTPEIKKLLISWDKPFSSLNLLLTSPHYNVIGKALEQRRSVITDSLADVFHGVVSLKEAAALQKSLRVKSCLIYPLSAKGKRIGALVFLLREPYANLPLEEIEVLNAFSDQAGIAIENALLLNQTKTTHKELQKSYERLKELDQMKDELVSISSHELRTPMTVIKSYLWMALNRGGKLTSKIKKYLDRAYESSERMITLVNEMLSVSRIDAGRLQLVIGKIGLTKVISAVITELSARAQEKKIELSFEKPKKELPKVLADEEKIREVLLNLIDNAIKFTPEKGKIVVSCRRRGKMVETAVMDTGAGIAKEDFPKLFQKFGRMEHSFATMAESGGGTGLGLYIVKRITDLHRGKI